ncbi:PemK-like protein [uncultured Clostridium sp.]|nr:PemK-like protein [uncultured Clostridium sp.]
MEKEKRRRGDIVWVDLGEHPGTRVQSGRKLCLIVSTDRGNGDVYQVIPGTSKQEKKDFPVHVTVKPEDVQGALRKETIFMAEQLTIVSEQQILMMIGKLEQNLGAMAEVEKAIMRQLELERREI